MPHVVQVPPRPLERRVVLVARVALAADRSRAGVWTDGHASNGRAAVLNTAMRSKGASLPHAPEARVDSG
ncbi:hypothetical protein [Leptolyngbya sp. 7M]|uniref:hypothetical protein n=1 Tax=Leptolyngbya sp. 7M TaxID=2812896 RepID=UPI001CEDA8BE|nr:hypothetical protein [Leptolyngbya sp. 7M]